jgi:L-lactate dehydrogenase (cytochrome)/(S)-mandelate dehydrogenase
MRVERSVNISDIHRLARKRLPQMAYDFIAGGCDDENGLVESEAALRAYRLVPRYLVDVSEPRTTAIALGDTFAMPFGISPTGAAGLFRRGADKLLALEAAEANVPFVLSSVSNDSIEDVMPAGPKNVWFQIYGTRDRGIALDMARRAITANVSKLVFTLDVPVASNRERNRRNSFSHPLKVTPAMIFEVLTHPGWTWEYLSNGGLPYFGNFRPYAKPNATPHEVAEFFATQCPAPTQTWDLLEGIRRTWPRHLLVKGILHPDDARRAVRLGADAVIVSNHGGRQLDRAPSSAEALPEILDAVGSQVEVMLDGGIRRGSDIVAARCLGATFTFSGRPTLYGAAAAGRPGIRKVLSILKNELGVILAQIGCPAASELGPQFLRRVVGGKLEPVG